MGKKDNKEENGPVVPVYNDTVLTDTDNPEVSNPEEGPKAKLRCWSCGLNYDGKPFNNSNSVAKLEATIKEAEDWLDKAKKRLAGMKKNPKRNLCEKCRG